MSTLPLAVDIAQSLGRFLDAVEVFGRRLAEVGWLALAIALVLYLAHQLARTRAWQNVLRAAYPKATVLYTKITAAYLVGSALNSILPARAGEAVKIMLAKNSIKGSSYPTVTSSFLVQSVFDTSAGILVLIFAISQGLLPRPPELPDLPAFDISFWAEHPTVLAVVVVALVIALWVGLTRLARRAEAFWERVRQGVVILTDRTRYLREVASWQALAWVLRFASYWAFLEAFHIGGSASNVLLVFSVQAVAGLLPLTPGGVGAQQALLVATLTGPGRAAVLAYSVGQQLAVTIWTALLGLISLVLVFRTTDLRGLVRRAQQQVGDSVGQCGSSV